jgi:hypothetical protein
MQRLTTLFLIAILVFSCGKKNVIIPAGDMVEILVDLYMADAAVDHSKYRQFRKYDTVMYQGYVFEKYGYNKADFDTTIAYYARNLEEMQKIHDQVIEVFQKRILAISDSLHLAQNIVPREDIWNRKNGWKLPGDGPREDIDFEIPTRGMGTYTFNADIKLYSDDESDNPKVAIYFYKTDSTKTFGKRIYFNSEFLKKDNTFHNYSITQELRDSTYTEIRGQVLGHTNVGEENWKKHAEVQNITFFFEPKSTD